MAKEKKGAKFGRGSRCTSNKAYKNQARWETNAAKRIKKALVKNPNYKLPKDTPPKETSALRAVMDWVHKNYPGRVLYA